MKLLAVLLALASGVWGQNKGAANAHYQTPEERRRMAEALASPSRDERQRPAELVRSLKIRPGSVVVDVGCGSGYMEPYFSAAVGPTGKVIAEDVRTEFLDAARKQAERLKLANVRFVMGSADDPKLPAHAADLIFLLDVYHHFDDPQQVLAALHKALAPGGRMAIVDYYKRPKAMPGMDAVKHIRADRDQVLREVESAGFRLTSQFEHIPDSQYVAIFAAR